MGTSVSRGTGIRAATCVAAVLAVLGCEPKTRHATLSLFFDGVPPPHAPAPPPEAPNAVVTASASDVRYREHGPYAAKQCGACHESAMSNKLIVPEDQLCAHCHEIKFDKKNVHGPVGSGDCVSCHDAHSSQYRYFLTDEPKALCLSCHDREVVADNPIHDLDDPAPCTECHDPHQSDEEYLMR